MAQESLLEREEEIELAQAVEAGREARRALSDPGHHTAEERARL